MLEQVPELPPFELHVPEWKENCPPDQVLIVSDGKRGVVLAWIGRAISMEQEHVGFDGLADDQPAGVWLIKVEITSYQNYWGEWDSDASLSDPRALTEHEWEMFCEDPQGGVWKESRWMHNPRFPHDPGPDDTPEGW